MTKPDLAYYIYTACLLYQLAKDRHSNPSQLDKSAWNTLRELGIATIRPTKRGCQGGNKQQQQRVSTVISHRPTTLHVVTIPSHLRDNIIPAALLPTYRPSTRQRTLRTIKRVDSHNCMNPALANARYAMNIKPNSF